MRELSLRLIIAFLVCVVSGGVFAYVATAIGNETIVVFDDYIIKHVQGWEAPWLTIVMKTFTGIGSTPVVLIISLAAFCLLLFVLRHRAQAYLLLVVIAGTGILNTFLKLIFRRERPEFHRLIDIGGYSFPSGHTMMAFSLYAILAFILWRNIRTNTSRIGLFAFALFMIVMIGTSRIYLGVHFPSDIVGGIAASAFWVIIATSVYTYFQNEKGKKIKTLTKST